MCKQRLPGHFLPQMCQPVGIYVKIRLVYLEYVARKYHFGPFSGTGYYSLYLMRSKILRLVYYEEHLPEAPAPYVCKRRNQKFLVLHHGIDFHGLLASRTETVADDAQIVHKRLNERTHLGLLVSRKESYVLIAENYSRPGQDYLVEVPLLFQSGSQGKQCLAGAGTSRERNEFYFRIQAGVQSEFLFVVTRRYAVGVPVLDKNYLL